MTDGKRKKIKTEIKKFAYEWFKKGISYANVHKEEVVKEQFEKEWRN